MTLRFSIRRPSAIWLVIHLRVAVRGIDVREGHSFRDRLVLVDDRADEFLRIVSSLGGYSTAEQAKDLGLANSQPRTHARLKALERAGFLRRIAAYPVIYQVTKSVARLVGRDLRARRTHGIDTIAARLLAMNFYLEARAWPAEFIFDHEEKVAAFCDLGCSRSALPRRGGCPYLREELVLRKGDGSLCVAAVDWPHRSAYLEVAGFVGRFRCCFEELGGCLELLVVTADDARYRLLCRLLGHPSLLKLCHSRVSLPIGIHRLRGRAPVLGSTLSFRLRTTKRQQEVAS
jgi:DNA-binding Lrp family transcriptional regulator